MNTDQPKLKLAWLAFALFAVAVMLAVLWMTAEVKRVRHIRELSAPQMATPVLTNR